MSIGGEVSSHITAFCRLNGYEAHMIFNAEKCLAKIGELHNEVDVVYQWHNSS